MQAIDSIEGRAGVRGILTTAREKGLMRHLRLQWHQPAVIRKLLAHLGMARSEPSTGPAQPESGGIA